MVEGVGSGKSVNAEERRQLLRDWALRLGVSLNEWATAAKLPRANALYNFVNGHSRSLAHETYEQLAAAFPHQITVDDLKGTKPAQNMPRKTVPVKVVGEAESGTFRANSEWPPTEQYEIVIPSVGLRVIEGLFGLVFRGHRMNLVYPPGTVLVCCPIKGALHDAGKGRRVIVKVTATDGEELSPWEITYDPRGNRWLAPHSSHPALAAVQGPQGAIDAEFQLDGKRAQITALVVSSYRLEGID